MQFTLSADNSGRLLIDGADMAQVAPANRGLAMVFQSYALYPHMSVRANLGFALKVARVAKDEIATRVEGVARMLDLDQLLDRKPAALSGGQRQRVAIARALAVEPKLIIADEVTSALDASIQSEILGLLKRLQRERNLACVLVTHDLAVASQMCDDIVVLYLGRVVEHGPVDILDAPKHPYTRLLVDSVPDPEGAFLLQNARDDSF
jgi:multiple sugar transport system ATP-binding protein